MNDVMEEIKIALVQVAELKDTSKLTRETRFVEDLDFDSGMFIEMLMTLEEMRKDLTIDPVKLEREDFETLGTLENYLLSLGAQHEVASA